MLLDLIHSIIVWAVLQAVSHYILPLLDVLFLFGKFRANKAEKSIERHRR